MEVSSKQICRLCLEITPTCESEPIEEIKKDILEVLLINVDFEIGDYAVACNSCVEKLKDFIDFKSHCINTLMDVDVKMDFKRDALQSNLISRESTCQENSQVCRLCMSFTGEETFNHTAAWKDGVLLRDMIRSCFPKMDLNNVHEPVVCKQFLGSIKKYCEFMESCHKVEQRIERFRYAAGYDSTDRVSLEDVLKFKDCNVLGKTLMIKEECSDVDIIDENVVKCLENEETDSIKVEEIFIKDELDHGTETTDPDQSEDNDSLEKDDFSKTQEKVGEIVKKGKKYYCPICPYSSERCGHIKNHIHTHSDNESFQCFLCPFIGDSKFSLKTHMTIHRGATKAYGCPECPYETDLMSVHRRHVLKHKDESEVKMQNCPLCPYRTKYSAAVVAHLRIQHDASNGDMYKCKECPYSTKNKNHFVSHQLVHLNPKEIPMYKCAKCELRTKYKQSLVRHMLIHKDPETVNKFKCDKCPYQCKRQCSIKDHMMIHSDKHPFSCNQCTYASKSMSRLILHKRVHQKKGETYKCPLCGYQAKNNVTLKVHMVKCHKDTSMSIMKCNHCPYETVVKSYLVKHMRKWHSSVDSMQPWSGTPL